MESDTTSKKVSFSILMANNNNASYIEEAIESVISQTYPNWELIIVDDSSKDNSKEVINKFLKNDRIKLLIHKRNQGYAASLRTAADNSSNNVLAILDADDRLHPKALEVMAKAYRDNPNYGFIYSTMWDCDAELKNCHVNDWIGPTIPDRSNIFKISISHFKTFTKNAYLKTNGFDPKQKKGVDKDIIFKLEEVTNLKYIDQPLYYYRMHIGGISQSKKHFKSDYFYYYAKLKAYKRRQDTRIPNLSKDEIYAEYYRIVVYRLRTLLKYLYKRFHLSIIAQLIYSSFPGLIVQLRSIFRILRIIL